MDGGRTWSELIKVNDDGTENDQFFPCIAVDPNGVIHIAFGDRRDDSSDVRYSVYYTNSSDRGDSFTSNRRVSDTCSNPFFGSSEGSYIGDYFGVAVSGDDVYVAWTDCRAGSRYYVNQDVMFARVRDIPEPRIGISPNVCSIGDSVTILGVNFSRLRDISLKIDGVEVGGARTDENGRFNATLIVPALSEGNHTVMAIDALGYCADIELQVGFGFDTIRSEFRSVNDRISSINGTLSSINERIESLGREVKECVLEAGKGVEERIREDVNGLRSELSKDIEEVKEGISEVEESVSGEIAELKGLVSELQVSLSNYLIAVLSLTIVLLSMVIALIKSVRRRP